jgi:membrane fusion protein, copper/silver efflux system
MKTDRKTTIIAASTLAAGLLLGWLIFGDADGSSADDNSQEVAVESETTWTCSMHPQIRQDEPGDCPLCGMDLITVDEDEGETDPMAIRMSATALELAGVRTVQVNTTEAVKTIRLTGKVEADERLVHSQSSHIPGRIEQLKVAYTGAYVRKGDAIASVYSPELVTAQEELFEAQKTKETVPRMFNAAKEKLKNWKLTDAQVDQLLAEGTAQETFDIQADVSGYVMGKKVNRGDYIRTGEALYEIADLSRVWVLFDLYESNLSWVKKGATVDFTVGSLPGESFEGTVSWIDPVIDPRTRVARARVEFNNSSLQLKPEMFVTGTVAATLPDRAESIVVPKSAVMWTGKRSLVYVRSDTDQGVSFVMREVILGPALGDSYIIESGLQEGEEIAVSGTFSIDAAAQLAGKPSMMSPEGGQKMTGHDHGGHTGHGHGGHSSSGEKAEGKRENFEVKGLCGMCKTRIEETALSVEGVGYAEWDQESTILEVVFDENATSVDAIQKAIAAAGHDTPLHKADDEVYENLPGCCKYERSDSKPHQASHGLIN